MKKTAKLFGIIALVAVIGFSMAGCADPVGPGEDKNFTGTIRIVPNTGVITGTELTAVYSGSETGITYQWKKDGTNAGTNSNKHTPTAAGSYTVTVSAAGYTPKTSEAVTVTGGNRDINVPPENKPVADRWTKWVDPTATATLDYSVDSNGVCTITVGGIAQPFNETDEWGRWKTIAQYHYTAKANTRYTYVFEAWTQSGSRDLWVQYYGDNDTQTYLGPDMDLTLTETRKTYTVEGQRIPKGGVHTLEFQCADKLGTFYVKVLSISESKTSTLTITNFSGNPGLTANNWVGGSTYVNGLDLCFSFGQPQPSPDGSSYTYYWAEVTGNSITLDVYITKYDNDRHRWTFALYTGNETVAAGKLLLSGWDERSVGTPYRNKVPITFTNGNATINFGAQMEPERTGTLTITNFSGSPGLTVNNWVVVLDTGSNVEQSLIFNMGGSQWAQITDSPINLCVHTLDNDNSFITFTGNVTVEAGDLWILEDKWEEGGWVQTTYTNKVPITFTNGNATINFDAQMEEKSDWW